MTFVDSNVLIDALERDPVWFSWSSARLVEAGSAEKAYVDPIVVAELSRGFAALDELNARLRRFAVEVVPLDEETAFLAGKRFQEFRRTRAAEEPARVLPDFLIGAHALTLGVPLLTRDPRLYRRYFPDLALITPDTHP